MYNVFDSTDQTNKLEALATKYRNSKEDEYVYCYWEYSINSEMEVKQTFLFENDTANINFEFYKGYVSYHIIDYTLDRQEITHIKNSFVDFDGFINYIETIIDEWS